MDEVFWESDGMKEIFSLLHPINFYVSPFFNIND